MRRGPPPPFFGHIKWFYAESLQQSTCSTLHISVSDKKSTLWKIIKYVKHFCQIAVKWTYFSAIGISKKPLPPKRNFLRSCMKRDPYAHIIGLIILLRRAPSSACCFEFEFNGFLWGDRRLNVNSKPRSFWIHLRVSLAWLLLACCCCCCCWCFAPAK